MWAFADELPSDPDPDEWGLGGWFQMIMDAGCGGPGLVCTWSAVEWPVGQIL